MKNKPSILVIDDEQIICDSCSRILSTEDYKVEININSNDGLQRALQNNYDLLLLDLNMAGMDGMQLLNKLRKEKPDMPVIIITGYPTKETKEVSKTMGVTDYILKPFKPNEILDPVKNVLKQLGITEKKEASESKQPRVLKWNPAEKRFWFLKNGWMQKGTEDLVRVGGHLPVFLNEDVTSIKTADVNDKIYRGFPVAELKFGNDVNIIIPSPVSGEIVSINKELLLNPSKFDEDGSKNKWIADIIPGAEEDDLKKCETRSVVFFSKDEKGGGKYIDQLTNLGYVLNNASTVEEVINSLSSAEGQNKVVVVDAKSFGEQGPQFAEAINAKHKDAKIIVFNQTDSKLETLYREKKIFYYAVDPVSDREAASILYGVYCYTKDKEKTENTQTTFLPQTIKRIQITNRNSEKVVLLSFDNVIKFNKGAGYLLIQSLLDRSYPIEIVHSKNIDRAKDPSFVQGIAEEKMKNDRIIVIYKENINRIPGSIVKTDEKYENSGGSNKILTRIALQPADINSDEVNFDINTARALAELIESEMTSK